MIAIVQRARLLAWLLAVALAAPFPIAAQQPPPAPPPPPSTQPGVNSAFSPEQLEQVVAPIALYPDPLLAQVLMASTYPLEVVEAARFVKANPNLKEDQLNEKLKDQTWDDSVKSLVSFPQVLELMDQKLDWVQRLGDAFLAQQKDVLDAVQRLRARAQKEGTLKSTPEQKVNVEPAPAAPPASGQQTVVVQQQPAQIITIEPTNPQVVYVPSYNPTVAYGAWPYPAYPPYYPYPPGYAFGAAALSFGVGMAVGAAVWGNCNWGGGEVNINNSNYQNYTKNVNKQDVAAQRSARVEQRQSGGGRSQWQHSPENRKGVQYRDSATQQRFNRGQSPQATQSRDAFRGRAEQGRQDLGRGGGQGIGGGQAGAGRGQAGQGLGGGQAGGRGDFGGGGAGRGQGGQGLGGGQAGGRGDFGGAGAGRGGGQSSFGGARGGGGAGAFQGAGSGGDARNFSNRGQSSRQSMGAGGGASRPSGGGGGGRAGGGGGGGGGGGRGGGRR